MIALISPAKIMQSATRITVDAQLCSEPRFKVHTNEIVSQMLQYTTVELAEIFRVSSSIARELKSRFQVICIGEEPCIPAVDGYNGVVYKHFNEHIDPQYIRDRLRISSLLYGLLRPFDMIHPYRMEGFVRLVHNDERVDRYWRDIQTQTLIEDAKAMGGTLLYLASKEEQSAFHWKEVQKAVRVIDFKFLQYKGDKLRQVVVYTKMVRGEMIRYMMEHKITDPNELKEFEWCGYRYNESLSRESDWVWVMDL